MIVLPTLQRRIRGEFLRIVVIFGVLGLLLVGAIFVSGRVPTLLVSMNYDSIAWGREMETAMNALRFPQQYPEKEAEQWRGQFESALGKARANVTEAGEPRVLDALQASWARFQAGLESGRDVDDAFKDLRMAVAELVKVNEQGMLDRLRRSALIRDATVLGAACLFVLGTLLAVFMADGISGKVSHPLRRAAEVLKARPRLGTILHLPPPQTLEVRILFDELGRLWSRLSELDALNLGSLTAEKSKLEAILESAEDAILVLDESMRVAHLSVRMSAILNVGAEGGDLNWRDLPTTGPNYMALRELLNANLQGKRDIVLQVDGEERTFSARRRELVTPSGKPIGQIFLLSDVTEGRRREGLRSEMMDWISHELKTPMQSLCLAAELLDRRKGEFDHEVGLLVETVYEDAARLRILAHQFLDIARMAPGALRLDLQPVNPGRMLERWLRPFELLAREQGIVLNVHSSRDIPDVPLDADRFAWVVSNLVSNAVRVSTSGDEVSIRLELHGGALRLDVEDQGAGLPPSVQARLFEPFSHGRAAGTREGLVGLGLAISRSIVEAHGGVIGYAARSPRGSRFTVSIPAPPEEKDADQT
jgi:signal transduction histidine kinase